MCPEDVGPELGRLLEKPGDLRSRLMDEWEKHVEGEVIKKQKIKLEGKLLDHVRAFDFQRVGYKPIHEIVQEFKTTPRYPPRFGGGLIIPRSPDKNPSSSSPRKPCQMRKQFWRNGICTLFPKIDACIRRFMDGLR